MIKGTFLLLLAAAAMYQQSVYAACKFSRCVNASLVNLSMAGFPDPFGLPIPLPLNMSIAEVGTDLQQCFIANDCQNDSTMDPGDQAFMTAFLALNITSNVENATACASESDINPFVPLCSNNSYPNMTAFLADFRSIPDLPVMKQLCRSLKCILVSYAMHTSCSPDVVNFYTQYLKIAAAPNLYVYLKYKSQDPFNVAWFQCQCQWFFDFK